MRRPGALLGRIPLKVVPTQNKTFAMLVESLDKTCLHRIDRITQRLVEPDPDVAGSSWQPFGAPWRSAGFEIKAGAEIPCDSGQGRGVSPVNSALAQELGWHPILHCGRLNRAPKIAMHAADGLVCVIRNSAALNDLVRQTNNYVLGRRVTIRQ